MPVVLIAAGRIPALLPASAAASAGWLTFASNPVFALLLTNIVALPLLFGRRVRDATVQATIWAEVMKPAGPIPLSLGAGGALKQVLVSAGLSDLLARVAAGGALSPIVLAWLVAVGIRLATGSATVATITTAGIMTGGRREQRHVAGMSCAGDRCRIGVLLARQRSRLLAGKGISRHQYDRHVSHLVGLGDGRIGGGLGLCAWRELPPVTRRNPMAPPKSPERQG